MADLKILMLSDSYPPMMGGLESEVQLLAEGLALEGNCEVSVCTLGVASPRIGHTEDAVKLYKINGFFQKLPFLFNDPNRRYHPPVIDWVLTRKIEKLVKEIKPDIVHTHNWISYSFYPLKKISNAPLCTTFHDFGFVCPCRASLLYPEGICNNPLRKSCVVCGLSTYGSSARGIAKSFFAYFGLRINRNFLPDVFVFTNPNHEEQMKHIHVKKRYLEHPIDTENFRPLNVHSRKDKILCWTSLNPVKGIETIFRVAEILTRYTFDIPYIGGAKSHYEKMKPRNVNLIAPVTRDNVPSLINEYPIVLGQLRFGTFGVCELEAMSCGKPVISYWNRKYDKFYDMPCPILSSKNAFDVADLIELNIGNESVGKLSRKWILQHHASHTVIRKLLSIYEEALRREIRQDNVSSAS